MITSDWLSYKLSKSLLCKVELDMVEQSVDSTQAQFNRIELSFGHANLDPSTLNLVHSSSSEWKINPSLVEIVQFSGGIMNTVCLLPLALLLC